MKPSVIPVVVLAMQIAGFAQTNPKCSDLAKFKSPGVTLEITRAAAMPAGRAAGARGGAGPMLPAIAMSAREGTETLQLGFA